MSHVSNKFRRERLANEIQRNGTEVAPCSSCQNARPTNSGRAPCIVSGRSTRCSECIRKGYALCDVSLLQMERERLQNLRSRLVDELLVAEEEEDRLALQLTDCRRKIRRLRKQLRRAQRTSSCANPSELDESRTLPANTRPSSNAADLSAEAQQRVEQSDKGIFATPDLPTEEHTRIGQSLDIEEIMGIFATPDLLTEEQTRVGQLEDLEHIEETIDLGIFPTHSWAFGDPVWLGSEPLPIP